MLQQPVVASIVLDAMSTLIGGSAGVGQMPVPKRNAIRMIREALHQLVASMP